jgi:hypothetical protein
MFRARNVALWTLAAPSTAFMYDGLGIMPLGQQLWLKELESYNTLTRATKPLMTEP